MMIKELRGKMISSARAELEKHSMRELKAVCREYSTSGFKEIVKGFSVASKIELIDKVIAIARDLWILKQGVLRREGENEWMEYTDGFMEIIRGEIPADYRAGCEYGKKYLFGEVLAEEIFATLPSKSIMFKKGMCARFGINRNWESEYSGDDVRLALEDGITGTIVSIIEGKSNPAEYFSIEEFFNIIHMCEKSEQKTFDLCACENIYDHITETSEPHSYSNLPEVEIRIMLGFEARYCGLGRDRGMYGLFTHDLNSVNINNPANAAQYFEESVRRKFQFEFDRLVEERRQQTAEKIQVKTPTEKAKECGQAIVSKVQLDYQDAIVKELIARADDKADDTETSQPEALYEDDAYADDGGDNSVQEQDIPESHEPDVTPVRVHQEEVQSLTLEEIYAETAQFEKMPVPGKMKYLQAIAKIYHSQPIHDDYYGLDCGFYDLFRHCKVSELEEIARISGVKIPASVYVDKGVLDIHLQWYVNVKVFGVDTTLTALDYVKDADYWSETPEKAEANNNPAMIVDWFEAEIENYECGKLTAEEMSEIVKYAPLGTLRTYARMNEIAPLMSNDEREGLIRAITARIFLPAENISMKEGEITAMLNKYAENQAVRRAILDGVRLFRREIQKRTEKGLSSEGLPGAILSVKNEYRRLRLEGFQLRRKLLRVICAEEISQACAKYVARCREIKRRHMEK